MEALKNAVTGDLVSRFISFVAQNCYNRRQDDADDRARLERVLLRISTVVEEAEKCCITNREMLIQLKMLIEAMCVGHYMLDLLKIQSVEEEGRVEGEMTQLNPSSFNAAKRLRFGSATTKEGSLSFGFGTSRKVNLKAILETLEAKINDTREFVILLGGCPRLPRQPYCTYLIMDKCMFGRHTEKEQIVSFLLCNVTDDHFSDLGILPIIGPHRVGKKTLVQHACNDERVRDCFSHRFFFQGEDLQNRELAENLNVVSGKCLFVVEFRWDVDEKAWIDFKSKVQKVSGGGSKIVLIGITQEVAKFGTAPPIWLKSLSPEEYWYFFKTLAFGNMDPDEHPRLASLGMQIATVLKGSFLSANIFGELLRANPNTQFWCSILSFLSEILEKHMFSSGTHPEDILEKNAPVDYCKVALVGGHGQGYLVYDMREVVLGQDELPLLTVQHVLMGGEIPEQKFDVLVWKSRILPYSCYVATYEQKKPAPQRMVGKKSRLTEISA